MAIDMYALTPYPSYSPWTEIWAPPIHLWSFEVDFRLSHSASRMLTPNPLGHSHLWEVHFEGLGIPKPQIHCFINKVTFLLPLTFSQRRQVVKQPPYKISGLANESFPMFVEVHLTGSKASPSKLVFQYDVVLQGLDSALVFCKVEDERVVIQCSCEEFKELLIRGGCKELPTNIPVAIPDNAGTTCTPLQVLVVAQQGNESESKQGVAISSCSAGKAKSETPRWDLEAQMSLQKQLQSVTDTHVLKEIVRIIREAGFYKCRETTSSFAVNQLDEPTLDKLSKLLE